MTLRLPFSWQKTRFSMYWEECVSFMLGAKTGKYKSRTTYLFEFGLSLRHLGWLILVNFPA
jgi:hypothetical protein